MSPKSIITFGVYHNNIHTKLRQFLISSLSVLCMDRYTGVQMNAASKVYLLANQQSTSQWVIHIQASWRI